MSRAPSRRSRGSCGRRPAWLACSRARLAARRRAPSWRRSTPGSPRASTRATFGKPRHCSTPCSEATAPMRIVVHLDMDAFYAAVEELCLRLQRGCDMRSWGRDGLGAEAQEGGARAQRALMSTTRNGCRCYGQAFASKDIEVRTAVETGRVKESAALAW